MSVLAIKGHATRGNEVIEILKMLSGKNQNNVYSGKDTFHYYFIDNEDGYIRTKLYTVDCWTKLTYNIFTLEEFLEKFPYKIGNRVRVPEYESEVRISKMYWDGNEVQYEVVTDEVEWYSAEELNKFNEPNKEALRYLNKKANKQAKEIEKLLEPAKEIIENLIKIDIPKGYKFSGVDNRQIVFEKIKSQYPKTYEECCKVLEIDWERQNVHGYKTALLDAFQELLICRDAYWKLAGDWKPDWTDNNQLKHSIEVVFNNVECYDASGVNRVLVFPTAEMRDAFYEHFKDLIEQCKELL